MKVSCYVVLLLASVAASEGDFNPSTVSTQRLDRCAKLGFDVDALDCKMCQDLATFLTANTNKEEKKVLATNSLLQECGQCCSDFQKKLEENATGRYSSVVLGVSKQKLKRYPRVASFVEQKAPQIERLEVKDVQSRLPVLQFFNEEGEKVEEVSVAHWDEDSITEFIEGKLTPEEKSEEKEEVERSDEL